jgi:hypothetical protein
MEEVRNLLHYWLGRFPSWMIGTMGLDVLSWFARGAVRSRVLECVSTILVFCPIGWKRDDEAAGVEGVLLERS